MRCVAFLPVSELIWPHSFIFCEQKESEEKGCLVLNINYYLHYLSTAINTRNLHPLVFFFNNYFILAQFKELQQTRSTD